MKNKKDFSITMFWAAILALIGFGFISLRSADAAFCNFRSKLLTDANATTDSVRASIRSLNCSSVDLSHNDLSFLPTDFFDIPLAVQIVSLNLSYNNLSSLESVNFSYLPQLQELDFSHNDLTVLTNGTFSDACCLKKLNFSHNKIARIEVGAFREGMSTVKMVDLSYNLLTSYEQWQYLFSISVHMDLSHNRISRLTNELGITITREQYRSVINLNYNNITTLEAKDLAIYHNGVPPSAVQIGTYGVYFRNNPFICDCRLHWLVSLVAKSLLRKHERINTLLFCAQPAELKNKSFGFLIRTPDVLICNVSRDCPSGCTCQERPQRGYTLVNCDPIQHLYTRLPAVLPSAPLLYLNMSGHQVRELDTGLDYLPRLYGLNVADNRLTEVTSSFMAAASSLVMIDLSRNQLTSLPGEARRLPIQHLKVTGNPFKCSCDFIWFGEWVRTVIGNVTSKEAAKPLWPEGDLDISSLLNNMAPDFPPEAPHDVPLDEELRQDLSSLTCRREGQTMALTEMSVASLGCGRLAVEGIAGGCVVLLLLCAAVVCWRRQYETKILLFWVYRHCKEACCTRPIVVYKKEEGKERPVAADEHYDVFVSVDEKDDVALTWVIQVLLPLLEKRDLPLSVYLPARQELPGECKAEARANAILKSRNTLVLITPGYSRNPWCRYEFDHACRHLEEHNAGKLVLLRMADKDDDDDDDNDNDEIANKNGEDNDVEDGKKDRPCPDCVKAGGGQQAVVDNGHIQYNDGNNANDIRIHNNHEGGDFVEAPNGDVPIKEARDLIEDRAAGDKPKNDHRELITIPDNRAGNKLCGAWCIGHGRGFHLPHLWRRQQRPDEKATPPRRQRAHKLARYCESGEHMIAVEPLNTYIAERRFWHISDRLLKQKLLYELSVVKKQTPAFV